MLPLGFTWSAAWKPISARRKVPIAASGAVNRPGNRAPTVNPITANVTTSTTPTATGHSGGPPQVAFSAVSIYTAATPARKVRISQNNVAPSADACRAQAGRTVVATRSPVLRRPSRDATHAARPAANGPKSAIMWLVITEERTVQTGGNPAAVRNESK